MMCQSCSQSIVVTSHRVTDRRMRCATFNSPLSTSQRRFRGENRLISIAYRNIYAPLIRCESDIFLRRRQALRVFEEHSEASKWDPVWMIHGVPEVALGRTRWDTTGTFLWRVPRAAHTRGIPVRFEDNSTDKRYHSICEENTMIIGFLPSSRPGPEWGRWWPQTDGHLPLTMTYFITFKAVAHSTPNDGLAFGNPHLVDTRRRMAALTWLRN